MSDEEIITEILEKVAQGIPIQVADYEFVVEKGYEVEMNELKKLFKRSDEYKSRLRKRT